MQRLKNVRFWLLLFYLILLSVFLYFLFSKFNFKEGAYNLIKSNLEYLAVFKESNFLLVSVIFIISGAIYLLLQGFGSILVLVSGFLFGAVYGTIIVVITLSLGASLTFIIANYFFKDLINKKFSNRFNFLEDKIKSNEFIAIFFLRLIGGIPLQIQNLLPVLFNVQLKFYFLGSLLGFIPQAYIFASLGAGVESQIKKNIEPPDFFELITAFEIYAPIAAFLILLLFAFFIRKIFYKK